MDETIIRIFIFGAGIATIGVIVLVLQKSGLISNIENGQFWNSGQDKMQHNDIAF